MGLYRLFLAHPRHPESPRLLAEHVDPAWLKQRGYDVARNLGEAAAVWSPVDSNSPAARLALHCRSGHALAIVHA
ncbi:hypothetical protein [Zoogloea sp.]|uniref:hypothetical protein n=1 Tax=Zoogloea sp. TaxID=49181 RepID=UPI00261BFCBE|nr:hypothetical protein [Zoogloea sp.]MDD3353421.1 hypothetical protein [Zoogloea sp.]